MSMCSATVGSRSRKHVTGRIGRNVPGGIHLHSCPPSFEDQLQHHHPERRRACLFSSGGSFTESGIMARTIWGKFAGQQNQPASSSSKPVPIPILSSADAKKFGLENVR